MGERLSKEKKELFDRLVISLKAAIKNSLLYPSTHPTFNSSIESFKSVLDRWLSARGEIDIGVSQENILLDGGFVKDKDELYKGLAEYLHRRGIVAISIKRGVETAELAEFFKFIGRGAKDLAGAPVEGPRDMARTPHLEIKLIDYSPLLEGSSAAELSEEEIWRSLCEVEEDPKETGRLTKSKAEFLIGLLKSPKRFASLLRRIYEKALLRTKTPPAAAGDIRNLLVGVAKHLESYPAGEAEKIKKNLAEAISDLEAELVVGLFEEAAIDGAVLDLSNEIFGDFTVDMTADFIVTLISNKGVINEDLVKVFDKLASRKGGPAAVAAGVAARLFDRKLLGVDVPSKLQASIKDLFKVYPHNKFMSQLYKLTVEMLAEQGRGVSTGASSALVREYAEFLKEENLKKERLRLLADIIYLENDAEKFKRLCGMVLEAFGEAVNSKNIEGIKEVFELFSDGLRPEQKDNGPIAQEAHQTLANIVRAGDLVARLLSFIPTSCPEDLDRITYVLLRAGVDSAGPLVDAFCRSRDPLERRKFGHVLSGMGKSIAERLAARLQETAGENLPGVIKEIFEILTVVDASSARLTAKKLMHNRNAAVRLAAFEAFDLQSDEDRRTAFDLFERERDATLKYRLLAALVETRDRLIIDRLFAKLEKGLFKRRILSELVRLCGELKVPESMPHLERMLLRKPFLGIFSDNALRVGAVASLGLLDTPEAVEVVKKALGDKSASVRKMCELVLQSRNGTGEGPNKGEKSGGL